MNNCALGMHSIVWQDSNTGAPPPGLYPCQWCGTMVPIHGQALSGEQLEKDQWALYERMRQDYRLFHMERPDLEKE